MFEKLSESRLRLSEEHRLVIGAMLVALRNECLAGIAAGQGIEDEWVSNQIAGSAENYKAQIQALDRIILRCGMSWDTQRLALGMNILVRALERSAGRRMNSGDIDEASEHYGTMGFDGRGDRITGQGNDSIPSPQGNQPYGRTPTETGSGGDNPQYVDARPDRHTADASDRTRTERCDSSFPANTKWGDSR